MKIRQPTSKADARLIQDILEYYEDYDKEWNFLFKSLWFELPNFIR